jgi:deoxyribodipyrimidine photo-lyase
VFEPTVEAALARLDAARPADYARTRNAVDGSVLRVSPYITHGFVSVPDAIARIAAREPLHDHDKLVQEFAWREFFHHVWRHLGEGILDDLGEPPGSGRYSRELPADVLAGATGVPAIDESVRCLLREGWLHNHARMWLASYLVHLRKCHWRAGADWMYSRLLDGDLASNHLSWQWVAGTFSSKPYLFDAANVARWAPAHWRSEGTAVDRGYPELEVIARSARDVGPETGASLRLRIEPTAVGDWPEPGLIAGWPEVNGPGLRTEGVVRVRLVHPWDLGAPPARPDADRTPVVEVGWLMPGFHRRFPWSDARWRFVILRMRARLPRLWVGDPRPLRDAGLVLEARASLNPGYREALGAVESVDPVARRFEDPAMLHRSFSRFWKTVSPAASHRPKPAKIRL